jgi:hypothetical protein
MRHLVYVSVVASFLKIGIGWRWGNALLWGHSKRGSVMTGSSPLADQSPCSSGLTKAQLLRRKPQRITITIGWQTFQRLRERADQEGRSLSNLAAFLLEKAIS